MSQKANTFLETERVGALMRRYSVPCIISLLVAALYNIVDQIFIANASYLGSYGNAANTVVFPLTVVALAIAVMIGDGCCAFVSICLGAGEYPDDMLPVFSVHNGFQQRFGRFHHRHARSAKPCSVLMSPAYQDTAAAHGSSRLGIMDGIADKYCLGRFDPAPGNPAFAQLHLADGIKIVKSQHLLKHPRGIPAVGKLALQNALIAGRKNDLMLLIPIQRFHQRQHPRNRSQPAAGPGINIHIPLGKALIAFLCEIKSGPPVIVGNGKIEDFQVPFPVQRRKPVASEKIPDQTDTKRHIVQQGPIPIPNNMGFQLSHPFLADAVKSVFFLTDK